MVKDYDYELELELEKHLKREELIFSAKRCPNGRNVKWLAPSCDSLEDITGMLRWLGFRIARITDDTDCIGHNVKMVETTNGVIVFVNTQWSRGYVCGRGY